MKTRLLTFCLALVTAGLTTVAMAGIDDPTPAEKVSGNYNGEMQIVLGDIPIPGTTPSTVTIEKIDHNTVKLNIRNLVVAILGENGEPDVQYIGNVLVDNVPVNGTDPYDLSVENGSAVIENGDFEAPWMGPMLTEGSEGSIPVSIESATVTNNNIQLKAKISILGMIVTVDFTGNTTTGVDNPKVSAPSYKIITSPNQIQIEGIAEQEAYTIYNLTGVAVKTGITTNEVNISELSKGIYLIKVGNATFKFVKRG